ncbi:hypothetical protein LRS10_21605 [Phenylobacterium sp. J426]|uniref:hypothetical protein n=1 Tax=Phenylobacterium sp. J426 TaxID=2898439 RepID=UPI002150ABC3|nr:hypothetical protein [Phenylobacterium sp. J426]MCR5876509.1 hypothetical protein [Phenylobacterium sp. J426]
MYLIEQLGTRWEMPLTGYKKNPTGGPTQPAVEGLLQLLPRIDQTKVTAGRIEMPDRWNVFRDAAMPALSLRYPSAIVLIDGRLGLVSAQSLPLSDGWSPARRDAAAI